MVEPGCAEWARKRKGCGLTDGRAATALDDLEACAGPSIPVVCAQNGVENERLAARRFARVYGMLVYLPATHLEPGVVQVNSGPVTGVLDAGVYPTGTDALVERVTADLAGATYLAEPRADIMRWKYAKLLSNLANAAQALAGTQADIRDIVRALRAEAVACFEAAGIAWASNDEVRARTAAIQVRAVGDQVRGGSSSWQSLARGTGSIEADFLNGEIALLGRLHSTPAPLNARIRALAKTAAREGRPPGSMSAAELRAALGLDG
ncbi:MAG: hypothetical protein Kow0010_08930 [Dehalococcoidia bacterium]